ncbi:MarR family winged helix-turn-helix transcriptional regulator [Aurantiacibacter rhizosphaerae]|uniref:MarR family transcriptional regulator n=1 Tax=Aurantiacibacter rhizosphaerae TaxID=2691582 RepID=A0A844XFZ3_9SPHN|nr:MarR family transcriptional regulator [Aurantiacibacter rhizosphaerae]MWV28663.1 MarR family transcriptional regulator [Aurantiacibacter rhizosphaerae]
MAKNGKEGEGSTLAEVWGTFGPSHVPYRLLLLGKMIDRLTTRHLRTLADLSLAEWRIVAHLAVMGETSASRLSRVALVDRAEISRAVRSLAKKDLIRRLSDPDDKRITLLGLTEEGENVFRTTQKARNRFFADLTSDLEAPELKQLDDYLFRLAKLADKMLLDDRLAEADDPAAEG